MRTTRRTHRPSSRLLIAAGVGAAAAISLALAACIAGGPPIDPITGDEDAGFGDGGSAPTDAWVDAPTPEPHAVIGASPSHGPFTGGQRVVISGNGFAADTRVWIGETEVDDVVVVDATRLSITAPPGTRGPADVTAQNGDDDSTKRTLAGGYAYDALYADPSSGPIAGGTDIVIHGQGTAWDAATTAFIDGDACSSLDVLSPTELACTTPKGTPGAKTIRVHTADEDITVLEAFTYEDSSDGFKGGLSGDPIDGELRVLVYNNYTGDAIPGAHVIVGAPLATPLVQPTDTTGVTVFHDDALNVPVTVTVSAYCHSPMTFVAVPVDTMTVYLDPVLIPSCAELGDPPGIGGGAGSVGYVDGEIVFPTQGEFQRGPFLVPEPIGAERQVAYIFAAGTNPLAIFSLPPESNGITPDADGALGYGFALASSPGNRTYYAVAGLEDRTANPPRFTAYSMGVVRGVPVVGDKTTDEVYIQMVPLDQALTLELTPPAPGPAGPDRLLSTVAVRLGADGFAILPSAQKTPELPFNGDLDFVGLPVLDSAFEGATYFVSSRAVTGSAALTPISTVASIQTNTTAFPVTVDGFVGVPTLTTPALNDAWDDQHLAATFSAGAPADITVYEISSGNGLVKWLVAAPANAGPVEVPDLRQFPDESLPSGPIVIGVYGARVSGFDYAKIRMRNLRPQGMSAYSLDYFEAHLP
ncbi:MAG: IPT/TIG domain-containing protein [Polyangiaceae bacterium]